MSSHWRVIARLGSGAALCGLSLAGCTESDPDETGEPSFAFTATGTTPSTLPSEGPAGHGQPGGVAAYAWQAFIAMTWPATADAPGVPLEPGDPTQYGAYPDGVSPKFMTWKRDVDLFPNLAGERIAWDEAVPAQTCADDATDGDFIVERIVKGDDLDAAAIVQAGSLSPLVDQRGRYVYYSVHVNRVFYDYIHTNRYYNSENWPADGLSFPAGSSDGAPSTMTKFAWRDVTGLPDAELESFYVRDGHILDTTSCEDGRENCACRPARFAMVGAHIVTKLEGYKQWIWATFEHRGNLAAWKGQPPSFQASPAETNPSSHPAWDYQPNTYPIDDPEPVNVVRVIPIPDFVEAANEQVDREVTSGTIWENYFLSAVQYPEDERALPETNVLAIGCRKMPDGSLTPNLSGGNFYPACQVANPTMETYIPNSSCSSCHESARQTRADYSFSTAFNAALYRGE